MLELIRSSARSLHPLLGLGIIKKRLLQTRRHFGQQQDREACCMAEQIQALIAARKKLIEAEITQLVYSIQRHKELIKLKQQTVDSYMASITEAEKGAAVKPVDFKQQMQKQAKMLEEKSAIVDAVIQLEVDRLKLRQAQGLLAK